MKRFLKLYGIEQKIGLRTMDMMIFGVLMPIGILFLIVAIGGGKLAGQSDYTFFQGAVPSLIAVGICASAFMGLPLTIADYRDKKILKHFFVTPCNPLTFLAAIVLCQVVMAVISAVGVVLVSVFAFDYQMEGNVLAFAGSWVLTMCSMFSIGMLLASVCRTVKTANAVTSIVYFPMLFLSGATIPFEMFPEAVQKVAQVLPLSLGIDLMKNVSMGNGVENGIATVIILSAITLICAIISVKAFRWE